MWTDRVRVTSDVAAADWLAARLAPSWATVAGTVPAGFAAYARILHPVERHDGVTPATTWAQVGSVTGRAVHPLVAWHELIDSGDPWERSSALWPDGEPEQGNLALRQLTALATALGSHTSTPEDCFFALWAGWGQLAGGPAWTRLTVGGDGRARAEQPAPLLTAAERAAPRLMLPGREYHLMRGPLAAVVDLARYDGPGQVWSTQSPNLVWPADRAWCVASEVDQDSTLVGGTAGAIATVLAEPALEALPIDVDDSLLVDLTGAG